MRGLMLLGMMVACGLVSRSDAAGVQKKMEFDQKVRFDQIDQKTGKVIYTAEEVDASFVNNKWQLRAKNITPKPQKGDRIVDATKQAWAITKVSTLGQGARYMCECEKLK